MARFARNTVPGGLFHVIARFVNREYLLKTESQRQTYLRMLGAALARSDWRVLAFALMSTHIHLLAVAGRQVFRDFIHPVHTAFGQWLNGELGRLGHVFAARPKTYLIQPHDAAWTIAYLHNNPVRAHVAVDPAASSWTSHRAYLGLSAGPPWLATSLGLELGGYGASYADRQAFHEFVVAAKDVRRETFYDHEKALEARRRIREELNAPVELSDARIDEGRAVHRILARPGTPLRRRHGRITAILAEAAKAMGVSVQELRSTSRQRRVTQARRLALLAGHSYLGHRVVDIAAAMGRSSSGATYLLRMRPSASDELQPLALEIAERLIERGERARRAGAKRRKKGGNREGNN